VNSAAGDGADAYNEMRNLRVESLSSSATATAIEPTVASAGPANVFSSGEKRDTVLCLVLVLLILVFYNPIVHNGFTKFDDNGYITDNVHVRAGLTWSTVKWAFTSLEGANWHPLTWLSHALDYQLFKLNPVGHHYVNVLLHAGNAVLLFLLLEWATGLTWPSFMVAALFALHPINVESVAWASERKNVLSMFFFLLTMHAYRWYTRNASVGKYLVVAALFALGLTAKPEIITLPFVLLLGDYWPLQRMRFRSSQGPVPSESSAERVEDPIEFQGTSSEKYSNAPTARSFGFLFLEKVPLLVLSAGSAVITVIAQSGGHAVRGASTRVRFGNALVAYARYLGKAFWPMRLAPLYPHPGRFLSNWQILGSAALLVALTAAVLYWGKSNRYLVTGWFWFLGTLVPVIGLIQVGVQAMADRYAYLSFIGIFICVAWAAAEVARQRRLLMIGFTILGVLILGTLGMLTRRQIAYWRDSVTLWRYALNVTQQNYFAHNALGYALVDEGKVDEAISEFAASEALHAYSPSALVAIGIIEQTHGHVHEAMEQYRQSLEASGDANSRAEALGRLCSAFMQTGDYRRAEESCGYALRENPDNSIALISSGLLAERKGDFKLALTRISRAMKAQPTDVGYLLLAQALRQNGQEAEADKAVAEAQKISPNLAEAQRSAAEVLAVAGVKTD
jgi:protein O-mannosyl-transferase